MSCLYFNRFVSLRLVFDDVAHSNDLIKLSPNKTKKYSHVVTHLVCFGLLITVEKSSEVFIANLICVTLGVSTVTKFIFVNYKQHISFKYKSCAMSRIEFIKVKK